MQIISGEQIDNAVVPEFAVAAVEKSFEIYGSGAYKMPNRFQYTIGDVTLLYMPCFTDERFGTKILTLVPDNKDRGLPALDGIMLLNNRETGCVEAVLDAKALTAWRTGATGAMAAKLLARDDAQALGVIGCGNQGLYQAICISAVRGINKIYLYDAFGVRSGFVERLKKKMKPGTELIVCQSAEDLISASDIVVTATFATSPVLPDNEALLAGKCYIAVGSYKPEMRELPDALFRIADGVFVDLDYACEESGDIITPLQNGLLKKEDVHEIHTILHTDNEKRKNGTNVFKTVGMALVDLVVASEIDRMITV